MSSRSKDRSDRSHSSHRRDSSPRRRRRSESPPAGPSRRDERDLPPSFGPGENRRDTTDDNLNILQRMQNTIGPLELLAEAVANGKELKVWTRNFKEIRGICTGRVVAYDKHWNLVLEGVAEVYLKKKKTKTPFLREIVKGEEIPDLPPRVPRKKASAASGEKTSNPDQPSTSTASTPAAPNGGSENVKESGDKKDDGKKKRRRKRTKKPAKASDREYQKLFVRGDNIVMIAYKED